jgi:hypothetical protein
MFETLVLQTPVEPISGLLALTRENALVFEQGEPKLERGV